MFPEIGDFGFYASNFENELMSIIKRNPMRQSQIIETFSTNKLNKYEILFQLENMDSQNKIEKENYNKQIFWKLNKNLKFQKF